MSDESDLVRDQETVRRNFWHKARSTLGRVPFTEDAVASTLVVTSRQAGRGSRDDLVNHKNMANYKRK